MCPARCGTDRNANVGPCGAGIYPRVANYGPHYWEEPCISGTKGSGAVFFSGCNMHCVFCQNYKLNDGTLGKQYDADSLSNVFLELQASGMHNINLVTAGPHLPTVIKALRISKEKGLSVPVVYNTNAYESVRAIRALHGLVDIYLPDLKYVSGQLSGRFSRTPDYFAVAIDAIGEMSHQTGYLKTDEATGLAHRGVLIRHLVLPNCLSDSRSVLTEIKERFGTEMHLSLMRQYAPTPNIRDFPLNRKLTDREYERISEFCFDLGFVNVYLQEKGSATLDYTPEF